MRAPELGWFAPFILLLAGLGACEAPAADPSNPSLPANSAVPAAPVGSAPAPANGSAPFKYETEAAYLEVVPWARQTGSGWCDRFSGLGDDTGSGEVHTSRSNALHACTLELIGYHQAGYELGRVACPRSDHCMLLKGDDPEMRRSFHAKARADIASRDRSGLSHPDRWIEISLLMFDGGYQAGFVKACSVAWGAEGASDAEHFKKCTDEVMIGRP